MTRTVPQPGHVSLLSTHSSNIAGSHLDTYNIVNNIYGKHCEQRMLEQRYTNFTIMIMVTQVISYTAWCQVKATHFTP